MKVVIASDMAGFKLKEAVKAHLIEVGHEVTDVGMQDEDHKMMYVDAAVNMAEAVQSGSYDKGIIFCGTGAGVSIVVNKFKGIYCVACESLFTGPNSAIINNANVLAMGGRVVGPENACAIADAYLAKTFCEGMEPATKERITGLYKQVLEVEARNLK